MQSSISIPTWEEAAANSKAIAGQWVAFSCSIKISSQAWLCGTQSRRIIIKRWDSNENGTYLSRKRSPGSAFERQDLAIEFSDNTGFSSGTQLAIVAALVKDLNRVAPEDVERNLKVLLRLRNGLPLVRGVKAWEDLWELQHRLLEISTPPRKESVATPQLEVA